MPARKDFAVLHHRALTDPRFDQLGEVLRKRRLALKSTAPDTARALCSRIWLALLRQNDRRGVLPADGISLTRSALGLGRADAVAILAGMEAAGLLVREEAGLRLRGFEEAY